MPTFKNEAAWIPAEKATYHEVKEGPVPQPGPDEVVIKVAYAAINPTDYKMQDVAYLKVEYPFIFGTDVAGTIAELGSNVTKFKVGDRVLGHCDSLITLKATNAGFQRYSTVRAILTTAIPDSLPFANASVLPLGFDTAADALFAQLKLPLPSLSPKPVDKTVFIWGGSSSCGSCAIQLAVAAGWRVATTASKANFEYVKSLGASEVFDHRDSDVVEQIVKTLKPGDLVTDMIGSTETQTASAAVLSAIGGGLLPVVLWPAEHKYENVKLSIVMGLSSGFTTEELGGAWGAGAAELGVPLHHEYLESALASGKFLAKPDPRIVGGLDKVQEGFDLLRKGVSASKLVIEVDASV